MKGINNLKRCAMQLRKNPHELSVMEAVDNLSHMAELDRSSVIDKTKKKALTEQQISEGMHALSWYDPEYYAYHRERVKETFKPVFYYLKNLYEKDKGHLKEEQTQRGIQALMLLVTEAAQKIDQHTQVFKGDKEAESVTELKEYKELQHFYLTKVVQRFQTLMEAEEKWQEEWGKGAEDEILSEVEGVRRDQHYELFLVRKEDGTPYFNRALLKHMQLIGQFDQLLIDPQVEDPFLRLQSVLDRDAHMAAKEILHVAAPYVDEYYKDALKFKKVEFVAAINKAVMSLMLAGNSRNLLQNSIGKHALDYFADFHYYLRSALSSPQYQKFISSPPDLSDRFIHSVTNLSHVLCTSFFLKAGSRKEMVSLIHSFIEKGSQNSVTLSQTSSPMALWNQLRDADESIRQMLKQFPSGPLMKTIALFNQEDVLRGFDPMSQQNSPSHLYTLSSDQIHVSCIRLPCPTSQQFLGKAEVVDEFTGFLRAIGSKAKNQRHLLINLQERTSLHEHARCVAIEKIQTKSEFLNTLMVVTFPKNADFYLQSGAYLHVDSAKDFMNQLKEQLSSGEACGFYLPPDIDQKELLSFTSEAIKTIHSTFFASKEHLIHKNRLDFIEIYFMLFALKIIEMFKPDTLSFTCKDAVDTGAAASAEMFAFLRMMNDPSTWSKEEKDFLLWMLYAPALAVRERAVDLQRLSRMVSALSVIGAEIEAHPKETLAACAKLYDVSFFKGLKVKES
jgi:hypothetical protein